MAPWPKRRGRCRPESGWGGRDEPSRGADDHAELLSELDSHDLALAVEPGETTSDVTVEETVDPDETFPQSVASGGPTPEDVILWTRIAPDRFDPDDPLFVQVATDEGGRVSDEAFDDVVYQGACDDATAIAAHDHTVKVDLDGHLDPGTSYAYRFVYDGVASRTAGARPSRRPTPRRTRCGSPC